jgi:hypothetical protein
LEHEEKRYTGTTFASEIVGDIDNLKAKKFYSRKEARKMF